MVFLRNEHSTQMATISECRYRWLRLRDLNLWRTNYQQPLFESGTGLSWSKRFGIVQGIAYQSATSAGRQIVLWVGLGRGAVRCRSRVLTVSQLSRQAKENPVRGADFERGKFSGVRPIEIQRSSASAAEGYDHRLPLLVCPGPDSEMDHNRGILPVKHPEPSATSGGHKGRRRKIVE